MNCFNYTLINTGSTIVTFNYRRCDDSMWENQVELLPGQTKKIWLVENTFSIPLLYDQQINYETIQTWPPPPPPSNDLNYTIIPNDDITYIFL